MLHLVKGEVEVLGIQGALGGPHIVSVLREGRKSANTRSSSGVIRGIPAKLTQFANGAAVRERVC